MIIIAAKVDSPLAKCLPVILEVIERIQIDVRLLVLAHKASLVTFEPLLASVTNRLEIPILLVGVPDLVVDTNNPMVCKDLLLKESSMRITIGISEDLIQSVMDQLVPLLSLSPSLGPAQKFMSLELLPECILRPSQNKQRCSTFVMNMLSRPCASASASSPSSSPWSDLQALAASRIDRLHAQTQSE